jgi:hypothetical protein
LAIAISAIFKMAATKTKWRHFHTAWLHVVNKNTGICVDLQIKKDPFKIVVLHTFSAKDP